MRRTLCVVALLGALPAGAGEDVVGVNSGHAGTIVSPPAEGPYTLHAECGYVTVPAGDDVVVKVWGSARAAGADETTIECQAYNAYGSADFFVASPGPAAAGGDTTTVRAAKFTICVRATASVGGVPVDGGAWCMGAS